MRPVLYSFRRCPYAMRARLALQVSGVETALREVVLRDKPQAFLDVSPTATVPCLVTQEGVIDESLEVMVWALQQRDPERWLEMPPQGWDWIVRCDGPFKSALDRTKYAMRYPDEDPEHHRKLALSFLSELDGAMGEWIFDAPGLADFAILPFVRQFAFIDKLRFDAEDLPNVQNWLQRFLVSNRFEAIMQKYPQWQPGQAEPLFP